ncbi:phosphatase PAP2 family protein [Hymenobacter sp. BT683]|uniref:Phosphatase PAP2 family protein n=1 Tax=Hymenobacter jeongseonensis TaxID=2791027 RepID=A0ABS0ILH2_9BACT|nr:phosphatase PAP2 family protein [Hymenobacter jeongseonensis]MBF9239214.1 phosphatase PAP2 family protein [Hymenobacter jeongseonensis]
MNALDYSIIAFINQFARKSGFFDSVVAQFVTNNLLKGGVLSILLWFLWFSASAANRNRVRQVLIGTLMGALLAMLIARVLVHELPFRARPLYNKELHFVAPIADWRTNQVASFTDLNSMPSDTATLVFSMVTGIMLVSRRIGLVALVYAVIFICLPRMYEGVHNPTDLLAGAAIGTSCVLLATRSRSLQRVAAPVLSFGKRYPGLLYACLFFFTSQVSSMFDDVREFLSFFLMTH